jgi:dipeptidase E
MKLLLTSDGFTTDEIIETAIRLAGKPAEAINLAVIAEAYAVEPGDHRWVLDNLDHAAAIFGGTFQIVNLLALDPVGIQSRLEAADIIFAIGGHTDYLMSVFDRSGLSEILPDLLKTKVYVGSSAGSMILGRRMDTLAYRQIYGEEGTYGTTKYLELVNFAMKPHLNSPLFPNNVPKKLLEVARHFPGTIYGINDSTAILVENDKLTIVGEEPAKIIDGQLL